MKAAVESGFDQTTSWNIPGRDLDATCHIPPPTRYTSPRCQVSAISASYRVVGKHLFPVDPVLLIAVGVKPVGMDMTVTPNLGALHGRVGRDRMTAM
jgi:hypothetical protein